MRNTLLSDIDDFRRAHRMGEHKFGLLAVKNGRLVERLRNGGRVWPDTEAKVRAFMRQYEADSRRKAA